MVKIRAQKANNVHYAQQPHYAQAQNLSLMAETHNVKAREHHGSESLDITIPTAIKRKFDISPGDLFLVEPEESDGELILKYKRIHEVE